MIARRAQPRFFNGELVLRPNIRSGRRKGTPVWRNPTQARSPRMKRWRSEKPP